MAKWWHGIVLGAALCAAPVAAQDAQDAETGEEAAAEDVAPSFRFTDHARALRGQWSGELTYRDFQSNARVTIPVDVTVTSPEGAPFIAASFAYTDPDQQMFSHTVIQPVGSSGLRVADFGRDGITVAVRAVTQFMQDEDSYIVVYEEQGRDNGQSATVRHTETVSDARYSLRRDVRIDGEEEFVFRNEIALSRAQ